MTTQLRAVSYLAPNLFWFYEAICTALSRAIGAQSTLVQSAYDPVEDPALQADEVDLAFMCGLPFMLRSQNAPNQFAVLGAPVPQLDRYQDQPVYFADVIVKADSPAQQFGDLAGKTLCYNNLTSNSGYNLLRGWMAESGLTNGFFGEVIPSGSHQKSIRWVVEGQADCSAIDSTVLEQELRDKPDLAAKVRICLSIGPSPMPPILAATHLGKAAVDAMRGALLRPDADLSDAMSRAGMRRFAPMQPQDYVVLGNMRTEAVDAGFAVIR
jgi:phosphonate transport system substrate-binding protein